MEEERQPTQAHLKILEENFGYSSFRPKQWEIIRSIIEDKTDNIAVMATGYGKSLLYQYPSVYLQGLTIVISPLISLMEDQVRSLDSRNIKACFMRSAQSKNLELEIVEGKYRIVYMTPKYAISKKGERLLYDVSTQLNLIAIDEAYCMYKWGDRFQPAYGKLDKIRSDQKLSKVPILAVSAVATPCHRDYIVDKLGLQTAKICCTGVDRPNLSFYVNIKGSDIWNDLKDLLNEHSESSIIIYCMNRELTDEMVKLLRNNGKKLEAYYLKMSLKKRREAQEAFMENRVKIMVATVAFGMGIDKPDVRLIIHYGAAMELETYYLAAGLAGRDGKQSKCVMFWNEKDFETLKESRLKKHKKVFHQEIQNDHDKQSNRMRSYLKTKGCRRKVMLQYCEGFNPPCCDNCESTLEASSSTQQNKRRLSNDEDINLGNPSPDKQPKVEPTDEEHN